MDLRLFASVLWRHKILVGVGFVAAVVLTFFSVYKITKAGIAYRQQQQWISRELVLVSQSGFPYGQIVNNVPVTTKGGAAVAVGGAAQFTDPTNRFNTLAVLYARLASSDAVRNVILRSGPIHPGEAIQAQPVIQGGSGTALPLIDIAGIGLSPQESVDITRRASDSLRSYIQEQQAANGTPRDNRVVLSVLERASLRSPLHDDQTTPQLFTKRSKTRPLMVFLVVTLLTIGLAFLIENLKKGKPPVAGLEELHRLPVEHAQVIDGVEAEPVRAAAALRAQQPETRRGLAEHSA